MSRMAEFSIRMQNLAISEGNSRFPQDRSNSRLKCKSCPCFLIKDNCCSKLIRHHNRLDWIMLIRDVVLITAMLLMLLGLCGCINAKAEARLDTKLALLSTDLKTSMLTEISNRVDNSGKYSGGGIYVAGLSVVLILALSVVSIVYINKNKKLKRNLRELQVSLGSEDMATIGKPNR